MYIYFKVWENNSKKIPVKGKSFSVNRETETPKSKLVKYSENAQSRQPALDLLNYPIFKGKWDNIQSFS